MPATLEDLERRVTALESSQNDNTTTLRWVVSKMAGIAATQDQHTLMLEALGSKVGALDRKIEALPAAVAETIAESVAASEARLLEAIRSLEKY